MQLPVHIAVIPAAGLGTRNFVSPVIPKEMLSPWKQPLISCVVDEAREAGITRFVLVLSPEKRELITGHFAAHDELRKTLRARGKEALAEFIEQTHIPAEQVKIAIQDKPLGLGHAVLCAREHVGHKPFAVLLPDEIMIGKPNCLAQMVQQQQRHGGSVIAMKRVPQDQTDRYGILELGEVKDGVARITGMVEKPKPHVAPSNFAIVGRYILQPEIFTQLEKGERGAGGEIQLTDAMANLAKKHPYYCLEYKGERFDCGHHVGLLHYAATMAVRDLTHGREALDGLRKIVQEVDRPSSTRSPKGRAAKL